MFTMPWFAINIAVPLFLCFSGKPWNARCARNYWKARETRRSRKPSMCWIINHELLLTLGAFPLTMFFLCNRDLLALKERKESGCVSSLIINELIYCQWQQERKAMQSIHVIFFFFFPNLFCFPGRCCVSGHDAFHCETSLWAACEQ